ncbi:MAG TPA: flagellar FlbD family protein [Bacillales bacterium]|nr:flagellar FlbD family protein [Bacillales bacterium]
MIELTRLNDHRFRLNACFIEQVESLPDTTITMVNGKKLVVKETAEEVHQAIIHFYRRIGIIGLAARNEKIEGD